MNEKYLQQLADLVYDYCGLNYTSALHSLQIKISKRLKQLHINHVEDYISYLLQHEQEWQHVVEVLTINETYFFREEKQLQVYEQKILPLLKQKNECLRVWSAACASGEEPYTLAMLSQNMGLCHPEQLQILATDIDTAVLRKAKSGQYFKKSLSFRRIETAVIEKWFDEVDMYYQVKQVLQQQIAFQQLNLMHTSEIERLQKFDVIFCRNVLIYFDDVTIEKVVRAFYNALKPGGYLFLGHAETITKYKNIGFETISENGTFYYRKG